MKLVLNDERELKIIDKMIQLSDEQPLLFRVIISKYNNSLRKKANEKYGTRFKAVSNGGDTIPYVAAMMNTLAECSQVSDTQKFKDAIASVKQIADNFSKAYKRWYHES